MIVWKPTREQIAAAAGNTVPDVIAPGLGVLFCGINPGLYTAAVGHHFARPGNRFWPTLYQAGFTNRLLSPFEEHELLSFGYGITNLVSRATASAQELSREEMLKGGKSLRRKVLRYKPQVLAVLGVAAYRAAFALAGARVGPHKSYTRQCVDASDPAYKVGPATTRVLNQGILHTAVCRCFRSGLQRLAPPLVS